MNSKLKRIYYLLLILIFPIVLYPVIYINFIPEIKDEDVALSIIFIYAIIYLTFLIRLWIKNHRKPITKTGISLLIIFIGILHYIIIVIINLKEKPLLESKEIKHIEWHNKRKIYLIQKQGLFKLPKGCEIGYKGYYLPIYHRYYKTKNQLEVDSSDHNTIYFTEYKYKFTRDSLKLLDLRRYIPDKIMIKTIHLNTDSI